MGTAFSGQVQHVSTWGFKARLTGDLTRVCSGKFFMSLNDSVECTRSGSLVPWISREGG